MSKNFVNSQKSPTFALAFPKKPCPDGGIGRRVGLKHQYRKMCRFDPGSGYQETDNSLLRVVGFLRFWGIKRKPII